MTQAQNKQENTLNSAKEKTSQEVSQIGDEVRRQAEKSVDQIQERAVSMVSSRKEEAASQIDGIARALRQTSNHLRDENNEAVAKYANSLADGVEKVSGYLHNNDVNQFLSDAEGFARRQPELFLGAAFTLGLLAARFFRSSSAGNNQRSARYSPRQGGQSYVGQSGRGNQWQNEGGRSPSAFDGERSPARSGRENFGSPISGRSSANEAGANSRSDTYNRQTGMTPSLPSTPTPAVSQTANRRFDGDSSAGKTGETQTKREGQG